MLRERAQSPFAAALMDATGSRLVAAVRELPARGVLRPVRAWLPSILPYTVEIAGIVALRRGLSLLRPMVDVTDTATGELIGHLRQRLWAKGGGFEVLGSSGRSLAFLRMEGPTAVLRDREGAAVASLSPVSGPERRLEVRAPGDGALAKLCIGALAALDRVVAG